MAADFRYGVLLQNVEGRTRRTEREREEAVRGWLWRVRRCRGHWLRVLLLWQMAQFLPTEREKCREIGFSERDKEMQAGGSCALVAWQVTGAAKGTNVDARE